MTSSEQINEIATACAKAQAVLKPAAKDAVNPAFKSRYADLASITEASRVYAEHGVAIFQDAIANELGVGVMTRLAHSSGQWIEFGPYIVPTPKKDAHGLGSATTYAKRYALQAALQIAADEDDDGNAAAEKDPKAKKPTSAPQAIPQGFSDWLTDLESVADEGLTALKAAWNSSPEPLRKFLTETQLAQWDRIKAKANRADASTAKGRAS